MKFYLIILLESSVSFKRVSVMVVDKNKLHGGSSRASEKAYIHIVWVLHKETMMTVSKVVHYASQVILVSQTL